MSSIDSVKADLIRLNQLYLIVARQLATADPEEAIATLGISADDVETLRKVPTSQWLMIGEIPTILFLSRTPLSSLVSSPDPATRTELIELTGLTHSWQTLSSESSSSTK